MEDPGVEKDHQEPSPTGANSTEAGLPREDDDGLYILSYLEEVIPDNSVLQVKMAHAMWTLEKETSRCYRCNKQGHLQKDCDEVVEEKNGKGPLQLKGFPQNKSAQELSLIHI